MASRGVLAWMVAIEPSWPVFMACSMSKASSPRHSPRMMRSGRMRSAFLTSSRWRISPLPSMLGGRVSMRPTCGCCSCSSAASSMVSRRSFSEMKADSALSIVVLPEPVPPEMMVVTRALHGRRQQLGHLRPDRADLDQLVQVERLLGEFADRDQRAVDGDRPHRDVDARAVEQARVAHRMRFVDAPADRRDDLVDDAQQVRLVLEAHAAGLEHAAALDIDAFVAVDQDVGDGRVLEQRLERAEPGHLVEDLGDEVVELLLVERQPLDQDVLGDQLLDVRADLVLGQLLQRRQVDLLDQPAVQADLGVEQLVAEQRIATAWRATGSGAGLREDRPGHAFERGRRLVGAGTGSGAATRRAVKRPTMLVPRSGRSVERPSALSRPGQLEFLATPAPRAAAPWPPAGGSISFLSCSRDLVARLDLVERHAAIDRLAHQAVVVRDAGREDVAEHLLDVGLAQAGREQPLLEPVDDHLRAAGRRPAARGSPRPAAWRGAVPAPSSR